jgi:sigma-B regulation protein RsbU (phosphoserine phosphatase)
MARKSATKIGWRLGWIEWVFLGALGLLALLQWSGVRPGLAFVAGTLATVFGILTLARLGLLAMRRAIWRLRDRLIVTYLFISVVPVVLLALFAEVGAWAFAGQIGAYLLNAELGRRVGTLRVVAERLADAGPGERLETLRRASFMLEDRLPGTQVLVRDARGAQVRWPASSTLEAPAAGFGDTAGLVARKGYFYLWAHVGKDGTEVVLLTPVTRGLLLNLVPNLGSVSLRGYRGFEGQESKLQSVRVFSTVPGEGPASGGEPPPANMLDIPISYGATLPVELWDDPQTKQVAVLGMRTRLSGILNLLFNQQSWKEQESLLQIVVVAGVVAVVVIFVAVFVGVSLTRVITEAVQSLYEGTQRIREGDLTHRIQVKGRDQLAELGTSFNAMAENLDELLKREKERQRMQAELEIAREVQAQLHPRETPKLGSLELACVCHAARMVSGDYFDYQRVGEDCLALAIGDVAGKGISAALLMATLQSAMRSQLRHCVEAALAGVDGDHHARVSTAQFVSNLNEHLYASTAPEKYATFFFSVYDDKTGLLRYTNAGHLAPILMRQGRTIPFDVNGTVVGAFPSVPYDESQVRLESGDLLVCYTDGITEPENEYGEMFGEQRLTEVVKLNAERDADGVAEAIVRAVQEWTSSPELQDDMTLVVARKL